MNNVISKQILNPNIKWYQPTDQGWHILTYDDFLGGISQWKNIFYEVGNLQPGQKFGVGSRQCDYVYLCAILAGIELGGKIIVMPYNSDGKQLLSPIQVWAHEDHVQKAIDDGNQVGAKIAIPWSLFHTFVSKFNTFEHLDRYFPDQNNIVLTATTSGTSGFTKVCEYTHRLFNDVKNRSIKIFNLSANDRVLHLSNMHHGGTGGVFFLPSLFACEYHYYANGLDENSLDYIVELIKSERITKAMFPNNFLVEQFLNRTPRLDHDFDIYINQANNKNWIEKIKRSNVRSINSLFGSTETLGPIFLNTITRHTNKDTYDPLNYGKLLDDHYDVVLDHASTLVKIKNHYSETLKDIFSKDERGDHIFNSRSNIIRIHDVTLSLQQIEFIKNKCVGDAAVLLPDTVANKIYCVFDPSVANVGTSVDDINKELQKISPLLQIDFYDVLPLSQFVGGIKINLGAVRDHFRQRYNLL